jgi:hypothetical protein
MRFAYQLNNKPVPVLSLIYFISDEAMKMASYNKVNKVE